MPLAMVPCQNTPTRDVQNTNNDGLALKWTRVLPLDLRLFLTPMLPAQPCTQHRPRSSARPRTHTPHGSVPFPMNACSESEIDRLARGLMRARSCQRTPMAQTLAAIRPALASSSLTDLQRHDNDLLDARDGAEDEDGNGEHICERVV